MSFGLTLAHWWHLAALAVPVLLWLSRRAEAKQRHIVIYHNSSLQVSYWEELLFRGVAWGLVLWVLHSAFAALVASSLLFGLFHTRNLWWASRKQVLFMCFYTGLVFGPIVGLIRWWSGDIYLGIAFHALHNFANMYVAKSRVPTDEFLRSRMKRMNWFERVFSGSAPWGSGR